MLSQTMNKLMDVGETMGAGKHSVELYVKLVDVVRNVGCALVATTFRHDHHDQHSLLFFHCSFVVVSIRLVFIGVHWCSLVFIGVHWCCSGTPFASGGQTRISPKAVVICKATASLTVP